MMPIFTMDVNYGVVISNGIELRLSLGVSF